MSPLFLFTLLIPEIIVHDVSFAFIRVQEVKHCLFSWEMSRRAAVKSDEFSVFITLLSDGLERIETPIRLPDD